MTFFEHIDALRPHLVRGVMAIGAIGLVAFFCKSFIIDTVLFGPQSPDFPTNRMLTSEDLTAKGYYEVYPKNCWLAQKYRWSDHLSSQND